MSKQIFATKTIAGQASASVEILSLIKGFQPISLLITAKDSTSGNEKFVEIADIRVMGEPQLVGFNGVIDSSQRGLSKFYSSSKRVNWTIFGSGDGQGLTFSLVNPNANSVEVFIAITGNSVSSDLIGQRK